jgi:hypothetical protein
VALSRIEVSEEGIAFIFRVLQLLVTAKVFPSSMILVTLMRVTICSSVLAKAARRHIPEDGILHSHRRENLKSYI